MDDPNRQRRQNDVPMHPSSNPRYHQPGQDPSQQRRSYGGGAAADRFRPSPINTSAAAAARGMSGSAAYSGYYQDTAPNTFPAATGMPQGAMGYHQPAADYGQDARQTQGFASAYNQASMMYNVPQASTQSSVYDTSHQFSSRQPAALQMMTTDVTAPYFQSEPANAAAAQGIPPQTASAGASAGVYQQGQADRSSMLQSYAGQMASMGGMGSQQQQQASTASAADTSMEEQEYRAPGGLEEAYASYQTALKEIFQNIINGVLASASDSLLNVSDWLLSHVAELGLNMDDQSLHADRIKLWNDFNHAWLALLQKQKDMMESGQQLQRSQSLVSQESLEKMGKELVRLCDGIERHGLVDYQYGVWEEQIIAILTECLDLYETPGAGGDAAGSTSHRA